MPRGSLVARINARISCNVPPDRRHTSDASSQAFVLFCRAAASGDTACLASFDMFDQLWPGFHHVKAAQVTRNRE